jgi:RNA polymerase sigma-70 factor (ECF subfamily)
VSGSRRLPSPGAGERRPVFPSMLRAHHLVPIAVAIGKEPQPLAVIAHGSSRIRPANDRETSRNDGNGWSIESAGQEPDSGIAAGSETGPENTLKGWSLQVSRRGSISLVAPATIKIVARSPAMIHNARFMSSPCNGLGGFPGRVVPAQDACGSTDVTSRSLGVGHQHSAVRCGDVTRRWNPASYRWPSRQRPETGALMTKPVPLAEVSSRSSHALEPQDRSFVSVARAVSGMVTSPEDAMDITQEAFVRTLEHWDRVSRYDTPAFFTLRVAHNLATSRARTIARRLSLRHHLQRGRMTSSDPYQIWESTDSVRLVVGCLPTRQRAAIILCDVLDLDSASAGTILGLAPSTVRVHLSRARSRIRQELSRLPVENGG